MHRFYLPDFQKPALAASEAAKAVSLGVQPGQTVNVFDGHGHEAQCTVKSVSEESVSIKLLQQTKTPAVRCRIVLAQAGPKKNLDVIVQKATELGVSTIIPLLSDRISGQANSELSGQFSGWEQVCIEACRQSGNNRLPEIRPAISVHDFLNSVAEQPRAYGMKLIASLQPDSHPLKSILADAGGAAQISSVLIIVGPDGDFTPAEINQAKNAGCSPLSLGPLVLRAETAAIYALSILHHELQG